ncbi:purine-nucleoside phosphorylase [Raoultibacter phocaeensis]|uniref:purine-nucleoside phosphorylase n=1 Tax=Raoultibacter phocaeensis TaxID=2479841 RepID=UPI00111B9F65|nr:purine-nucleoside phosphorylase [Raoultibacter phocaeensis]
MLERTVLEENLMLSAYVLKERLGGRKPAVGLVLGSGLNPLGNEIENAAYVPYAEIPRMKTSTAESHVGRFVCGTLGGKEVLCMQGRLHGYEGNNAQEVAYPVWLMERMGVEAIITTNAAGAVNESYEVGDFCMMADQINFTGRNPIAAADPANLSDRFFSMTDAFDEGLRAIAREVAQEENVRLQEGVYLGLLGPSFETPAEIRMFRGWGADTVAMSVCEEVIAARHVGLKMLGISLVSNMAAGIEGASPTGIEVLEVAKMREGDFKRLVTGIVARM